MKKLTYLSIALSAFSLSLLIYYLRPIVTPVSLCEVSQHIELYRFNEIHIKAYLDSVGINEDDFDFNVSDFKNGCLTGASLYISERLKEQLKNDESLKIFIAELREKNDKIIKNREGKGIFVVEVEIVGKIEKQRKSEYGALVAPPPFVIKANLIKQISQIRFVSNKEILKLRDSE
jgi:hypothetical protein